MGRKSNSNSIAKGQFNTLAQNGTASHTTNSMVPIIVKGDGSDKSNRQSLLNRAKKKVITQTIVLALIDIALQRKEHDWVRTYWNTYHCLGRIIDSDGRLYGNYCKNRFCTLCAGNRKADIINKYLPVIAEWEEAYLVTLTTIAVPSRKLKSRMERMTRSLRKILNRNKKRLQRGTGIEIKGIRSLECNYNPKRRTYNPHFHLIVSTKEAAQWIIDEWLKQCTPDYASRKAQHMRKVDDKLKDLIEVVKYGSKIFTDPTMKKGAGKKVSPIIYAAAFHNIIKAMSGLRIFERFGFNLPKALKKERKTVLFYYEKLVFFPELYDWVSEETAEVLSGYQPSAELLGILGGNMNLELQ